MEDAFHILKRGSEINQKQAINYLRLEVVILKPSPEKVVCQNQECQIRKEFKKFYINMSLVLYVHSYHNPSC